MIFIVSFGVGTIRTEEHFVQRPGSFSIPWVKLVATTEEASVEYNGQNYRFSCIIMINYLSTETTKVAQDRAIKIVFVGGDSLRKML